MSFTGLLYSYSRHLPRRLRGLYLFFFLVSAPISVAFADQISVAFSPEAQALGLVLKTIGGAEQTIEMSAYVYTSAPISKALIDAHKRGVFVRVVLDQKGSKVRNARAALNALALAGIEVRLNGNYAIHHDKFVIVDGKTVQTGSFNYTKSAADKNSENVIVIYDNKDIANTFYAHWEKRFDAGEPYKADLSGQFED